MNPEILSDKLGRKVKVYAKVDGERRKVLLLKCVKPDPRGRISVNKDLANKRVLVMILEPIMPQDVTFIRAVKSAKKISELPEAGELDDRIEEDDEE